MPSRYGGGSGPGVGGVGQADGHVGDHPADRGLTNIPFHLGKGWAFTGPSVDAPHHIHLLPVHSPADSDQELTCFPVLETCCR